MRQFTLENPLIALTIGVHTELFNRTDKE